MLACIINLGVMRVIYNSAFNILLFPVDGVTRSAHLGLFSMVTNGALFDGATKVDHYTPGIIKSPELFLTLLGGKKVFQIGPLRMRALF